MRFNPGPGWGGHCIPIDPFYLSWKAREFGRATHFIELAGEINVRMQEYVTGRLQQIDHLLQQEAVVSYHDPHIPRVPRLRSRLSLARMESVPLTAEVLEASDAVLLVTDHSSLDYELVLRYAPLIVDTRGVYREGGGKVVKA
jgi:UDP-N-acetyl-D-glucosamine dehydrogenase